MFGWILKTDWDISEAMRWSAARRRHRIMKAVPVRLIPYVKN